MWDREKYQSEPDSENEQSGLLKKIPQPRYDDHTDFINHQLEIEHEPRDSDNE